MTNIGYNNVLNYLMGGRGYTLNLDVFCWEAEKKWSVIGLMALLMVQYKGYIQSHVCSLSLVISSVFCSFAYMIILDVTDLFYFETGR